MKIKPSVLISFILPLAMTAQSSYTFTLVEAIDYALEYNAKILSAEKSVLAAEFERRKTIATGLPQINVDLNYNNWLKQQVSLIPAEFFGGNPGEFSYPDAPDIKLDMWRFFEAHPLADANRRQVRKQI